MDNVLDPLVAAVMSIVPLKAEFALNVMAGFDAEPSTTLEFVPETVQVPPMDAVVPFTMLKIRLLPVKLDGALPDPSAFVPQLLSVCKLDAPDALL
jgi:hypothetical protein